jgi:tripartite-type tricarboxylate transporter receptor subunit TctC
MMSKAFTMLSIAATVLLALVAPAAAQDWPNRPITAVVPFAAGGPVDIVGRILASRMSELLGQQIVVENPGGAGGMNGTARVVKSAPDGYTVLVASAGVLALNQSLYKRPLYNAATDLEPVALFSDTGRVLITNKSFPANTLAEFITYAKANHSKMQYGSAGAGSGTHVCAILLDMVMGTTITHVPYRGASIAMQDLIGGRIDFIAEQVASALPQIEGGNVKAIATLGAERAPGLENLPTAAELGIDGLNCGSWNALAVPKGTPREIVQKLSQASSDAIDTPSVIERFKKIGVTVTPRNQRSPEYLGKYIVSEIERWAVPIKASGVVVE